MGAGKEKPVIAIAGPTASGKTSLGVALALKVGGEVINCDSVQIYSDIYVATAKPTKDEMQGVPHHLIGYVDPRIDYTAADWAVDAGNKIREIEGRGNVAILVGGTGFYLRTLREPLFEAPKTDLELRERVRRLSERKGRAHMHSLLKRLDPAAAGVLFPNDVVRVTRAIEVFFQTGRRFSEQQPNRSTPPEFSRRIHLYVLDPPRKELYSRINERTLAHFRNGLVDEVAKLKADGVPERSNALGAHGYRRVCEHLRGERSLESAIEKSAQDVRNYAKRQRTWFKREPGAVWLHGFGDDPRIQDELLGSVSELF
jgi:tRNA dimethylallyltransferase